MRALTAFVSAAVLVLSTASGAFAQKTPDFSGTWTLQPAPAAPAAEGRRGGGVNPPQQLTLTQDAKTLTMSWTQAGRKTTETLNLDGSESKTQIPGVTVEGQPLTAWRTQKATWEANRLVVVARENFGGKEMEQRRVLSMDGDNLVFELIMPDPQGGNPTVVRVVYKKN